MENEKIYTQCSFSEHEDSNSSEGASIGEWEILEWVNNNGLSHPLQSSSSKLKHTNSVMDGQSEILSASLNNINISANKRIQDMSLRAIFGQISGGSKQEGSRNPNSCIFNDVGTGTNRSMHFGGSTVAFGEIPSGNNESASSNVTHSLFGDVVAGGVPKIPSMENQSMFGNPSACSKGLSSAIGCGKCAIPTVNCAICNEFMCDDCLREHLKLNRPHRIICFLPPIGSPSRHTISDRCDVHNKMIAIVCNCCKKLICEDCFMENHRGHLAIPLTNVTQNVSTRIVGIMDKMNSNIRDVKGTIDDTLKLKREMEHNFMEIRDKIQKTFRQLVIQIEERERHLLEEAEKIKNKKLATLDDQMAGLKSVLSGLWQTTTTLNRVSTDTHFIDNVDLASSIVEVERQLEQLETSFSDLQPKEEKLVFYPPDIRLLDKYGLRGEVALLNNEGTVVERSALLNSIGGQLLQRGGEYSLQPGLASPPDLSWSSYANHPSSSNSPVSHASDDQFRIREVLQIATPKYNYIPGSMSEVVVRNSRNFRSFGGEGHGDGEVSRAWGICSDRNGRILVSDRRNNRVQVFSRDGIFKFSFGRKGTGDGQFELPAGISTDIDDRIIVVDKDNHRIQIFTFSGIFLLKFGGFGREPGQFQYPWDVAVNTRRQIVVADSRNHRIQQFDSEGRFIRKIVLDNFILNKLPASPRGLCFTPEGHVIVSDFDNHCLYRVNLEESRVLVTIGREGNKVDPIEFNRPSGVCCDDSGQIIVADSKNQRIVVLCQNMRHLWNVVITQQVDDLTRAAISDKDRVCYVNVMADGQILFLSESSPDCKDGSNPNKKFIHIL